MTRFWNYGNWMELEHLVLPNVKESNSLSLLHYKMHYSNVWSVTERWYIIFLWNLWIAFTNHSKNPKQGVYPIFFTPKNDLTLFPLHVTCSMYYCNWKSILTFWTKSKSLMIVMAKSSISRQRGHYQLGSELFQLNGLFMTV